MPIPAYHIVSDILRRSEGEYAFLSTLDRRVKKHQKFKDYAWRYGEEPTPFEAQPHEHDLFFTPLRFTHPKRTNENVHAPGVLFADLDPVDPAGLFPKPSIAWKTSKWNYQAVWFLSKPMTNLAKWAELNRRLTYHTGADRGGWHGSKLLRVPTSVNWKRRDFGDVLWHEAIDFEPEWMDKYLKPLSERSQLGEEGPHPRLPNGPESASIIRNFWPLLSLRTRSMLMEQTVQDRSLHIVRTAYRLAEDDMQSSVAFRMIWNRPWNKWKDNPDRLWTEVLRCYED